MSGEGSYHLVHLDSFQPNGEVKMTCNCNNYPASFMFETTQSEDKNILILVTLTKLPSIISKLKDCVINNLRFSVSHFKPS